MASYNVNVFKLLALIYNKTQIKNNPQVLADTKILSF